MVIHQFNKLIRNKWLWGVFAIAISLFFAFDFLVADFMDRSPADAGSAGVLGGKAVDAKALEELLREIRGFGRQYDPSLKPSEANRQAWENYAALLVAHENGIEATDAEVQAAIRRESAFQQNGAFSFALYQSRLRENGLTTDLFEASLRHRLTLMRVGQAVLGAAAWSSPAELDQALADMTDVFTVRVATFVEDPKDAAKVTLDEAGLRAWYDANTNSLALPDRVKIRYVTFDATNPMTLAKMTVTEDEMRDRYDVTVDKYTSTDTNGVEKVKPFEEVKAGIEKELRQIAAVLFYETNLIDRAYAAPAVKGASRLDEIAKEEGLKVETSDWFAVDGTYKDGFMKRLTQICPGAQGSGEAVAELDPENESLRYAVVSSDRTVWLIERDKTSPKHVPTFAEAKEIIRPRALSDARADAFKAKVEAVAAKGAEAVLAEKVVSTNITFTVADLRQGGAPSFENEMAVARAAMKLRKGEVSDFRSVGTGKAILVVCSDRVPGDVAKAMVLRSQVRDDLAMLQLRQIPDAWKAWNLTRLGLKPSRGYEPYETVSVVGEVE